MLLFRALAMPSEAAGGAVSSSAPATPAYFSDEELKMLEGTWPVELLRDRRRQPLYVQTADAFVRHVLTEAHDEEFVILPRGDELLDVRWEDCLPRDLREALEGCKSTVEFARRLRNSPEMLAKYRADVEYVDPKRQQRDLLKKEKLNLGKRIDAALNLVEEGKADPDLLYIAELRLQQAVEHPIGGDKAKTICSRDIKDVLGPYASWTLYWDRFDEGFFVGGRGSGKGVHIDQVLWSNVGRNWKGYKLAAMWPKGEVSKVVANEFYDRLLTPPLSKSELDALRLASKVVLLRPGDVYAFSGGCAHTVLCVSEELCHGAYESFVSLNPTNVEMFLHTDDKEGAYALSEYAMSPSQFNETKDDCVDQLEDAADHLEKGGPAYGAGFSGACSATWQRLNAAMHSDAGLQATLRNFFVSAVDRCRRDEYFDQELSRHVVDAAESLRRSGFGAGGLANNAAIASSRICGAAPAQPPRSRSRSPCRGGFARCDVAAAGDAQRSVANSRALL
eukprot:TRINITY_DN57246_c0_g1_i1.p1 TRINITY_DN57246_c0_g1~~TRINITY_DN57246_c0_g1_i1.p1  ORF type:complete len:506 (-),score=96.57 TRINITY_DN57246_c0_g1_i1:29-1546(-)